MKVCGIYKANIKVFVLTFYALQVCLAGLAASLARTLYTLKMADVQFRKKATGFDHFRQFWPVGKFRFYLLHCTSLRFFYDFLWLYKI